MTVERAGISIEGAFWGRQTKTELEASLGIGLGFSKHLFEYNNQEYSLSLQL